MIQVVKKFLKHRKTDIRGPIHRRKGWEGQGRRGDTTQMGVLDGTSQDRLAGTGLDQLPDGPTDGSVPDSTCQQVDHIRSKCHVPMTHTLCNQYKSWSHNMIPRAKTLLKQQKMDPRSPKSRRKGWEWRGK